MPAITQITPYTSLIAFILGVPTAIATYYQAWKTRQEATQAREGLLYSKNCLEFVLPNGVTVNMVPLATLHSLPKPGDVVLLPGTGRVSDPMGAFRVDRIEHIFTPMPGRLFEIKQARLVKAVAHVQSVFDEMDTPTNTSSTTTINT
jgi:hypothetical protein